MQFLMRSFVELFEAEMSWQHFLKEQKQSEKLRNKENNKKSPPKLYIPSTINICKKVLTKAIWADKKWTD